VSKVYLGVRLGAVLRQRMGCWVSVWCSCACLVHIHFAMLLQLAYMLIASPDILHS
jgi:hypothetical protein